LTPHNGFTSLLKQHNAFVSHNKDSRHVSLIIAFVDIAMMPPQSSWHRVESNSSSSVSASAKSAFLACTDA
jgi:hypothetical protein